MASHLVRSEQEKELYERAHHFQASVDGCQIPNCLYWLLEEEEDCFEKDGAADLQVARALISVYLIYSHDPKKIADEVFDLWAALPKSVLQDEVKKMRKKPLSICELVKDTRAESNCEGSVCEWKAFECKRIPPHKKGNNLLEKNARQLGELHKEAQKAKDRVLSGCDAQDEKPDAVSEEIRTKALEILQHNDPVAFIMRTYGRLHVGDAHLGKILLCSIASQSVLNGEGLQPKLSGESGKGKTHACKSMAHLIPREWVLETTVSSKALYYHKDLRPGTLIFSDDIQLSEDLESTLKRSMTNFQQKTEHHTLDSKRNVQVLELPERLVWWLTSVNDEGDIQLLNRFLGVGIDDSQQQDKAVAEHQLRQAESAELALPDDKEVQICREILRKIKERTFRVAIPFAHRFEWLDSSDRRNLPRFLDLIRAFAVLRFMQRTIRENGVLFADLQDFEDAKELYQSRAENQLTKLNDAELALARWMAGKGELATGGILYGFKKPSGKPYTQQAIHKLLHGRDGKGGLLSKVPGLDFYPVTSKDYETGRSVRRNVYVLPSFYILGSFSNIVRIKPEDDDSTTSHNSITTSLQPHLINQYINNSNNKIEDATTTTTKIEDTTKENFSGAAGEQTGVICTDVVVEVVAKSKEGQKIAENRSSADGCSEVVTIVVEAQDSGCSWNQRPKTLPKLPPISPEYLDEVMVCIRLKKAISEGITDLTKLSEFFGLPVCLVARFPGVDEAKSEEACRKLAHHHRDQHFKQMAGGGGVLGCAICGAALVGRSRVERNGALYCARPGCGYPLREREVTKA